MAVREAGVLERLAVGALPASRPQPQEFKNLGMHFTPLDTICCGFSVFQGSASDQILSSHRFENHGLLQEAIEEQTARL
jgi:hypothetical protein